EHESAPVAPRTFVSVASHPRRKWRDVPLGTVHERIRYTATARAETNDILAHIAEDNSAAAVAVGAAIKTQSPVARLLYPHGDRNRRRWRVRKSRAAVSMI